MLEAASVLGGLSHSSILKGKREKRKGNHPGKILQKHSVRKQKELKLLWYQDELKRNKCEKGMWLE